MPRPALFVGSSSEGLPIARAVKVVLDDACEVTIWNEGVFSLTTGWLEALVRDLPRFDFAVLVLTADDMTVARGAEKMTVRDNVLFELGLCIGSLGRDRTYMVYDRTNKPALPTDLDGITAATFMPHSDGNLIAAVGAPCEWIRRTVEQLGIRKDKGFRELEKATRSPSIPGPLSGLQDASPTEHDKELFKRFASILPADGWSMRWLKQQFSPESMPREPVHSLEEATRKLDLNPIGFDNGSVNAAYVELRETIEAFLQKVKRWTVADARETSLDVPDEWRYESKGKYQSALAEIRAAHEAVVASYDRFLNICHQLRVD
jgi:hypothetical protein